MRCVHAPTKPTLSNGVLWRKTMFGLMIASWFVQLGWNWENGLLSTARLIGASLSTFSLYARSTTKAEWFRTLGMGLGKYHKWRGVDFRLVGILRVVTPLMCRKLS